jgi:hypothetical protein
MALMNGFNEYEKAAPRFELGVKDLQSSALPLGHAAVEALIYQTFECYWLQI